MRSMEWWGGRRESALALLMLGIFPADDAARHLAPAGTAEDKTTVFADGFAGSANFHAAEGRGGAEGGTWGAAGPDP